MAAVCGTTGFGASVPCIPVSSDDVALGQSAVAGHSDNEICGCWFASGLAGRCWSSMWRNWYTAPVWRSTPRWWTSSRKVISLGDTCSARVTHPRASGSEPAHRKTRPCDADSDNFTSRPTPGSECHERVETGAYVPGKQEELERGGQVEVMNSAIAVYWHAAAAQT
jgi:hypothetical protein